MKKNENKLGSIVLKAAMSVTKMNANSACAFHIYQPQLPESAKKLRKF